MSRREAWAMGVGSLALVVSVAFAAWRFEVATDITHFLPSDRDNRALDVARALTSSELGRTMILLVEVGDADAAARVSRAFEAELRAEPAVVEAMAFLDAGPPDFEAAFWKLYETRRFAFLAPDAAAARERLSPAGLRDAVDRVRHQLALPISGLISRIAPADPLLVLPDLMKRIAGEREIGLTIVDGRYVTQDRRAAVLFLGTSPSSLDAAAQRPVLAGVDAAFARVVEDAADLELQMRRSGASLFAVSAATSIERDIRRVSVVSVLGILGLLLVLFRSFRLALLVLPVLGAGFVAGTVACLLAFGTVHGLTLAFGAALIGVSIDYAVHFHCHQVLLPHPGGPRRTLRGISRGLGLSAATTIGGFAVLVLSAFPGLRELAVFATCGIAGALAATFLFLPGMTAAARPTPIATHLVDACGSLRGPRCRPLQIAIVVAVSVLGAIGATRSRWSSSISELNRPDPALLAEDRAVRDRVAPYEQRRIVVAKGGDEEAALQVNERVAAVLAAAEAAGELSGWRSVAAMLPSAATQRAVDAAVRTDEKLWSRMCAALSEAGFRVESFEPFRAAVDAEPPAPLTYADLAASQLSPLVRPFRIDVGDQVGFVSFLHGVHDEQALRTRLADLDGAGLVDVEAALSSAHDAYRRPMIALLFVGLAVVLLLVFARHRSVLATAVVLGPALLAACGTLGALAWLDEPLNILSLFALLMVISMGVDYGVMLEEARRDATAHAVTSFAVFVAGVLTILGFGMLALSGQPPLRSIGLTSVVGVLLCLLLAPAVSALVRCRHSLRDPA